MLPSTDPTTTKAWEKLQNHVNEIANEHLRSWFLNDSTRFEKLSISFQEVLFDFSKNRITRKTLNTLTELMEECGVKEAIEKQFSGEKINETENRAVLHTALRNLSDKPVIVDGKDLMPEVKAVLRQMKEFSEDLLEGRWTGRKEQRITDVVNIGIGGSDLGPVMVYEALKPYHRDEINCHFVSNVDGAHIEETLKNLNPDTTLFIIASKTFTTQETMTNAHSAREWFLRSGARQKDIARHFVAVSTNEKGVEDFGIDPKNMFVFWDWVGGRYSLWSSIGLSLCCGLGYDNFEELLSGAHEMDQHFSTAALHENIPVLMAGIGLWYTNFLGASSEAIIPYSQNLHRFAAYFQQGNMESNGKMVDRNGERVNYTTGPIVWGEPGTNGQHAFFQLLHQGTHLIPIDFIGFSQSHYDTDHHQKLMANFFAQSEALMKGRTLDEVQQQARSRGEDDTDPALKFKVFEGNRPSTTILAPKLTPSYLGILIAAYEHKIFVQGLVWNIYSYDQWGVELGKVLAKNILPKLKDGENIDRHDDSTAGLIRYFLSSQ